MKIAKPFDSSSKETRKQKSGRCKFTPEEDAKLRQLVSEIGLKNWGEIAKQMPNRTGRQCRDRYCNYLQQGLTSKEWTPEEDELVLKLVKTHGFHWVEISKKLKGRSGNNVKNRWHKFLSRYQNAQDQSIVAQRKTKTRTKQPKKVEQNQSSDVTSSDSPVEEVTTKESEPIDILSMFGDEVGSVQLFPMDGEANDNIFSLFRF